VIISVAQLKRHPGRNLTLKLSQPLQTLELGKQEIGFGGPVEIYGEVCLNDASVMIAGKIQAELELSCGRCLEKYRMGLEVPFLERFVSSNIASAEEDRDECRIYEGDEIDLGSMVMDSIILALPMQHLCAENCRGICPVCGINLNSHECHCLQASPDVRISALAKLLPKEKIN